MPREKHDFALTHRHDARRAFKRALVVLFGMLLLLSGFVLTSADVKGQDRWTITPNRGGLEGDRARAQMTAIHGAQVQQQQAIDALQATMDTSLTGVINQVGSLQAAVDASLTSVSTCGNQGMLSGPQHATANPQGCLPSARIETSGETVFSQPTRHQQGAVLGDNPICNAGNEGMLRYVSAQKAVLLCTGAAWIEVGAAPSASGVFTPVSNANLGQTYTSNAVTVSGFFGVRTATASNGATIVVNGSPQGASANVEAGNSVALRMAAASTYNTQNSTTLSLSSYNQTWTITTRAQDTTPNSFSFSNLTNQAVSTQVQSNAVTISGFDGPLTVSVSGNGSPQLQVAGGAWVTSGLISPGQSLRLRLTTSASYSTAHTATVTLGTYSTAWSATTLGGTCNLPWGGTINNGQSVTAYQAASVACGQTCASQTRTCSGGVLSGTYTHQSCSVRSCETACVSIGQEFQGGKCATTGTNALIAASSDTGSFVWGSLAITRSTNSSTNGQGNTAVLAAYGASAHPAASACANLTLGGFDDWYLPAIDELDQLYQSQLLIGGFSTSHYWSSTEASSYYAWYRWFGGDEPSGRYKDYYHRVRCVRSVGTAENCTLSGVTVNHGSSRTFYNTSSSTNCAGAGLSRTCSNGTLSGSSSYSHASCSTITTPQWNRTHTYVCAETPWTQPAGTTSIVGPSTCVGPCTGGLDSCTNKYPGYQYTRVFMQYTDGCPTGIRTSTTVSTCQ